MGSGCAETFGMTEMFQKSSESQMFYYISVTESCCTFNGKYFFNRVLAVTCMTIKTHNNKMDFL